MCKSIIAAAFCVVLLSSCAGVGLPSDWPVRGMSLPAGSQVKELQDWLKPLSKNGNYVNAVSAGEPIWAICFDHSSGLSYAVAKLEPQLIKAGYEPRSENDLDFDRVPHAPQANGIHCYTRPNGRQVVCISWDPQTNRIESGPVAVVVLNLKKKGN